MSDDIVGKWKVQHYRKGLDDALVLIDEFEAFNAPTNLGINYLLDAAFGGVSQVSPWYIGLIDAGATALSNTDTLASKAWAENMDYDEASRVEWDDNPTSSRTKANTTTADFTMNSTETIRGLFVAEDDTKGGTTGLLWSTAIFSTPASVVDDDVLKLIYSVGA